RGDENVVLIVVDCLRADHLPTYGYGRETAPNVEALARDGVVFEHAVAQSNWTKPAVVSLLTSLYVSQHGVTEGRLHKLAAKRADGVAAHVVPASLVTLPERLKEAGLATAGLVHQGHLPDYMGFAQGFDVYDHRVGDSQIPLRFAKWVRRLGGRRFFAYLHFLDLHFPYAPAAPFDLFTPGVGDGTIARLMRHDPEGFRKRIAEAPLSADGVEELRALYDGDLRMVDARVGRVLAFLREQGLYDSSLIVLTSDHGEALLEHGVFEHGADVLYAEVVRIPLIVKLPRGRYGGRRVGGAVQAVDVMPTVLDALGLEPPEEAGGRSLLGLIEGRDGPRPAFTEATKQESKKAVYQDGHKFVFDLATGHVEVFRFVEDPFERVDLAREVDPVRVAEARRLLEERVAANALFARRLSGGEAWLRTAEIEQLRALGYVQ
ncbi:MAG: sulfatase, partial [Candidatus Binatia bacterium]